MVRIPREIDLIPVFFYYDNDIWSNLGFPSHVAKIIIS